MFLRLTRFYVGAELRSRAGAGDLAFLITFLESCPSAEVPERCVLLARTSIRSYNWIRGAILASVLVPILIEACVAYAIVSAFAVTAPGDSATLIAMSLMPVNAMFVNPIFSSALALLYFRARQANGEDVALTSVVSGRL
jgi:hypothetical protein